MGKELDKRLSDLYWKKGLTSNCIANILEVSKPTILNWMKKANIPRRKCARKAITITKINLNYLYINKQLSTHQIAKLKGCSQSYIRKLLKNYNINIRKIYEGQSIRFKSSETKRKMKKASLKRWSSLDYQKKMSLIRGGTGIPYENTTYPLAFYRIRPYILKRDDYNCQNCKTKIQLSVHHIDYDKNNNKESNLITLCYACNTKANFNKKYYSNYYREVLLNV